MKAKVTLFLALVAITVTGAPAAAATFSYEAGGSGYLTGAGKNKGIKTTFNDETELFTWSSTIKRNLTTGVIADGGWLVVNDGPMPRKTVLEQVIFYLDGKNEKVSAYVYDGNKKIQSWKTTDFLDSADLMVDDTIEDERTFYFDFDMSRINAMTDTFGPDWEGTSFDDKIGVWYHSVHDLATDYEDDGSLSKFSFEKRTIFDIEMQDTTKSVPEPATAAALGMTVAAAAFTKRFKQSA